MHQICCSHLALIWILLTRCQAVRKIHAKQMFKRRPSVLTWEDRDVCPHIQPVLTWSLSISNPLILIWHFPFCPTRSLCVYQTINNSNNMNMNSNNMNNIWILIVSVVATHGSLDSGSAGMTMVAECSSSSCLTASSAAFSAISSAARAASRRSCCSLHHSQPRSLTLPQHGQQHTKETHFSSSWAETATSASLLLSTSGATAPVASTAPTWDKERELKMKNLRNYRTSDVPATF